MRSVSFAIGVLLRLVALLLLDCLDQRRHDLGEVFSDAEARGLEDVCVGVLVDRDDVLGSRATSHVLAGARDGDGDIERWALGVRGRCRRQTLAIQAAFL